MEAVDGEHKKPGKSRAAWMEAVSILVRIPLRNRAFMGTKEMLCIQMTPQQL